MSEDFVDHKTSIPVGTRAAAIEYLENLIKELPNPTWEVVRTISEGNLVFLHARFTPDHNAPAYAIGDVFRLENDKIVEHWDIIGEPVKEQHNPNSRF
jgi:predicted SnoaL-like aldol condensation-catalyzing enzyme